MTEYRLSKAAIYRHLSENEAWAQFQHINPPLTPHSALNRIRLYSGIYYYGKTPMQTFRKTLHIAVERRIKNHNQSDNAQHILINASWVSVKPSIEFYS